MDSTLMRSILAFGYNRRMANIYHHPFSVGRLKCIKTRRICVEFRVLGFHGYIWTIHVVFNIVYCYLSVILCI